MQRVTVTPDQVGPNPYQPATRLTFEPGQLEDLASVGEIGFIHTPVARPHPTEPDHYQMAVGWRRRCAWQLFRAGQEMPLDVDESLDDAAMFRHMVIENGERLNVSAVEKARLIEQYMAFGHTQAEAGQLFHLTQSGASNLLRIIHYLPEPVVALVQQGALPERHARQLIGLARIQPAKAIEIAQQVAASTDPDTTLDDTLSDYLEKTGGDLHTESSFPVDWAPDMSADIEGQPETPPACTLCPNYLAHEHNRFCARPECMKAKQQMWLRAELARLSDKLGIPAAGPDDKVKVLKIDWQNMDTVQALLKRAARMNGPDCLRLVADDKASSGAGDHYHRQAIGSDGVLLASTDPNVLKREIAAKESKAQPATSAKKEDKSAAVRTETPEQKRKRIEKDEAQQTENREKRAALHKARYDLVWLILHTAETLADTMQINGGILLFCTHLTKRFTNSPQYDWEEYKAAVAPLEEKFKNLHQQTLIGTPVCDADESEQRRYILVRKFADAISGFKAEEQFSWARGLEKVQSVVDEFALFPPDGWDQPPIHKTDSNCHICGVFTPGPAITGVDKSHGWMSVDGIVTCSTKCRGQLDRPEVIVKKVAKPSAEFRPKSKSPAAARKSQTKGKKR